MGQALEAPIDAPGLLWSWVRMGWTYRRIGSLPQNDQNWYADRVKYEMGLILERGLADFFLFTSDTIRWGKDHGIPFGPGRGSTAASAVAYLLRITEIAPHKYKGMVFERFLDISRPDPPDIDVDCSDERRHEVWAYLAGKYGRDCVGSIGNFVGYRGKNSLADVARVHDIPLWAKDVVANLLIERSGGDSRFDATLEDTFTTFPAAQEILEQFPDIAKACRLEGNVRGMSIHAAGLIIANSPLTDICAVYERNGTRVMSIDKYDAEYVDALKLDFLGLTTIGMIARCLDMAGLTLEDLYAIPDTDPSAIDVFRRGDVVGVFQFEGRATRLVNRDVHPDHFMHITDINALSRPGPLFSGQTAAYVEVRHGRAKMEHLHPLVDEITKDTYGQIIYQEQILRILKEMGGFDWFSVSQIRRIISKKMGEAAFQMSYEQFAQGAADGHGVERELADKIWKRLVTSGTYSFNIAHAISYSMLAFWCVSGGTQIYDWDNQQYISVSKAFKNGTTRIACYDEDSGKTVGGTVKAIIKNSALKECVRIRTSSAKNLICTPDHLILTPDGYSKAGGLKAGDLVAAEKRYSPMSDRPDVRAAARQGVLHTWADYTEEEKQSRIDALNNQTFEFRSEYNHDSWHRMSPERRAAKVRPWIEASAEAWGRLGKGPCGETTHSPYEADLCIWLCSNGIDHKHQVPFSKGIADFLIKGILVEMTNGLWPVDWDKRFSDGEGYQIVTPDNFRDELHWALEEEHLRNGEEIVWDEILWIREDRPRVTYDIVMEGNPHNFLANGIVVHNCAWLKTHYPLEFYAASLIKAGDADTQFRLMRDALGHSIDVRPPSLAHSRATWRPVPGVGLVAGWRQIPRIGPTMAPRIEAAAPFSSWEQLHAIHGIGKKTTKAMEEFTTAKDPFGLYKTEKRLRRVRRYIRSQKVVPLPTHDGDALAAMQVERRSYVRGHRYIPGPRVVYAGVVRRVEYKDIVEDERSRTGKEIEEILSTLKRPDLIKRATLHMYDVGDEEVYARINRWKFPALQRRLETIHINHDVVVIAGNRISGFGTPVAVDKMFVIDPED